MNNIANDNSSPNYSISIDEEQFSEKELKAINDLVDQIYILDTNLVVSYGNEAQKGVSNVSNKVLKLSLSKNNTSFNEDFESIIKELEKLKPNENKSNKFFSNSSNSRLLFDYHKTKLFLDSILNKFQENKLIIMQDMDNLNKLKKQLCYYEKTLSMYILAGQKAIDNVKTNILPKFANTKKYQEYIEAIDLFNRKLYDLNVSKTICIQEELELNIMITNDAKILDKINIIMNTTIPLWKNQITIAIGIANARDAIYSSSDFNSAANDNLSLNTKNLNSLLKKFKKENSSLTEFSKANDELIDIISSAKQLHSDINSKRKQAEYELRLYEKELEKNLKKVPT